MKYHLSSVILALLEILRMLTINKEQGNCCAHIAIYEMRSLRISSKDTFRQFHTKQLLFVHSSVDTS